MKKITTAIVLLFACTFHSINTQAQALILADINAGNAGSFPFSFTEFNGKLYFGADDGFRGYELWSYDGSAISIAADINFGSGSSFPIDLTVYNGKLYFKASLDASGAELWSFDGSTAQLEADIISGPSGSNPSGFKVYDGKLYFRASDGNNGVELWSYDGTNATMAADIVPGSGSSFVSDLETYNGELFFQARDASFDIELWKFDGTNASRVADLNSSGPSAPSNLIVFNNLLYFSAYDGAAAGEELWSYDGSQITLASDIAAQAASSSPEHPVIFQNQLYFTANDGVNGREWWAFDGTASVRKTNFSGTADAQMNYPAVLNNKLYFSAQVSAGVGNAELWSFDGTNRALEADIHSGANGSEPSNLTVFNNKIIFDADDGIKGRELWSFDPNCEPIALCRSISVYLDDQGNATINVADIDSGSTANCGEFDFGINRTSFSCDDLGSNTVTLTIRDLQLNEDQCNAQVTVIDSLPPDVQCKDITILLNNNNAASISPLQVNNASSDNCALAAQTSVSPSSFTLAEVGQNTVTLSMADQQGLQNSCTASVYISGLKVNAGNPTQICKFEQITLGGAPSARDGVEPYTYSWTPVGGLDDPTKANPIFTGNQTRTFTLNVTDAAGINRSTTVRIGVASLPTADAGEDGLICNGERYAIGGSPTATGGQSPYDYLWSPSTGLNDDSRSSATAAPPQTTDYTVLVTDDNGCTASDEVTVTVGGAPQAQLSVISTDRLSNSSGNLDFTIGRKHFFGTDVTILGDLNGDGVNDLAVGTPLDDENRARTGAVHILFMNADGTVLSSQKIGSAQGNLPFTLAKKDAFGTSVAGLGDVNQDGLPDLMVGAVGDDQSAKDGGTVYTLFLNSDGTVLGGKKISVLVNGFDGVLDKKDFFGQSCAGIGDFDNDGVPDALVGSPFDDEVNKNSGSSWLLLLNADGTVKETHKISNVAFGAPFEISAKSSFGHGLTAVGDLDGNGVTDFAIGAPYDNDGGTRKGAVWIVFMNQNGSVKAKQKISENGGGFSCSLEQKVFFGYSLASIGDYNSDGTEDLLVGSPADSDGGRSRGAVWTLFLGTNGFVLEAAKISQTQGGFSGQLNDKDKFGSSVANIGDINNDGHTDFAVGSPEFDDVAVVSGAVWLLQTTNSAAKMTDEQPAGELFAEASYLIQDEDAAFKIFPNPAASSTIVQLNDLHYLGGTLHLLNLQGNQIYRSHLTSDRMQIKLDGLQAGTYILRLTKGKLSKSARLVVLDR